MIEPTTGSLLVGWKVLGELYAKYQAWDLRKKTSKKAIEQQARADMLMAQINRGILSGGYSNQSPLVELVREFEELIKSDLKPNDYATTKMMIKQSKSGAYLSSGARSPVPAKKAAAKKAAPAKKATLAKKAAPAKKAAAKKAAPAKRAARRA